MANHPYLPPECRNSKCNHTPGHCIRYRSRRCLSGECTHASQNLICGVSYPTAEHNGQAAR